MDGLSKPAFVAKRACYSPIQDLEPTSEESKLSGLNLIDTANFRDNVQNPQNANDHAAKLSQEAFQKTSALTGDNAQAPSSTLGRVGLAGLDALRPDHLAQGIGNAVAYDYEHPMQVVKMVGTSALLGAALKTVLPEGGTAGFVAGAAIGGYFLYQ